MKILTKQTYSTALILQSILETEGVVCVLTNLDLVRPQFAGQVTIKVNEEDLEKARQILKRFKKESNSVDIEDDGKLKILLPVDFSEYSDNACLFAVGLAGKFEAADLHLLYAYYLPDFNAVPYSETMVYQNQITEQINDARERAAQNMDRTVRKVRAEMERLKLSHVSLHSSLIQGTPSESVLYFSESFHPQLIIVGARGKGAGKEFLGSSSHKIVVKSTFPVLVIPENSFFEQLGESCKIVYATDFDESDFMAIRKLMGLISTFNAEIHCIHFVESDAEPKEKKKMEGLKSYFMDHYPEIPLHCEIMKTDDLIHGLDRYITDNDIGILSVTTHKRNIISAVVKPSLTKKLFYHTNIPLLVFHSVAG